MILWGESMTEKKELLQEELEFIFEADQKLNYEHKINVQIVRDMGEKNHYFQTSIGKRYMNKLSEILDGTSDNTCFFCNHEVVPGSVFCETCKETLQKQFITWENQRQERAREALEAQKEKEKREKPPRPKHRPDSGKNNIFTQLAEEIW